MARSPEKVQLSPFNYAHADLTGVGDKLITRRRRSLIYRAPPRVMVGDAVSGGAEGDLNPDGVGGLSINRIRTFRGGCSGSGK